MSNVLDVVGVVVWGRHGRCRFLVRLVPGGRCSRGACVFGGTVLVNLVITGVPGGNKPDRRGVEARSEQAAGTLEEARLEEVCLGDLPRYGSLARAASSSVCVGSGPWTAGSRLGPVLCSLAE